MIFIGRSQGAFIFKESELLTRERRPVYGVRECRKPVEEMLCQPASNTVPNNPCFLVFVPLCNLPHVRADLCAQGSTAEVTVCDP